MRRFPTDAAAGACETPKARSIDRAFGVGGVPDNDLLSHGQSVLSSARRRFTVLFGMGRSGASGLWSSGIEGCARRHDARGEGKVGRVASARSTVMESS